MKDQDYAALITITVNEIKRNPKVKEILLSLNPDSEEAANLISAFMIAAIERFKTFATKYRTQPEFAKIIQELILETL